MGNSQHFSLRKKWGKIKVKSRGLQICYLFNNIFLDQKINYDVVIELGRQNIEKGSIFLKDPVFHHANIPEIHGRTRT
jgi:hypothetical protein